MVKRQRNSSKLLSSLIGDQGLDVFELSLFEWYFRENKILIDKMLSNERTYINEQIDAGVEDLNDSGLVAVGYYAKRIQYAHIIYIASILEIYLERSCSTLISNVGEGNVHFRPEELSGNKWEKHKKFLERYGQFKFPHRVWSDLNGLIVIRNILVHDNGSVADLKKNQRVRIEKFPGIKLGPYELTIEDAYVRHCFEAFRELVRFIDARVGSD